MKEAEQHGVFYGWYIVAALAISETISFGILVYAFSVFAIPMEQTLGWSRAEIYAAQSLSFLLAGFGAMPVGYWLDKHGSRLLMTTGSALATLLVAGWAFVDNLPHLYITFSLIGITMSMTLYDPAFVVVANWFTRRRGLALAIVTFAAGFASTIFLPLSDFLLKNLGMQNALLALAALLGMTTIPLHLLILRRRPQDLGLLPDGAPIAQDQDRTAVIDVIPGTRMSEAIRSKSFVWLTVAFALAGLATFALRSHIVFFLTDNNFDPTTAAWIAGFIGAMQVFGRVIFAPLEMRYSSRFMTAAIFVLLTFSISLVLISRAVAVIWLFVVLFGAALGAMTLARPALLADLFGAREYGRINSVMAFSQTLVRTAAPIGTGLLYDRFNSYQPVLWILVVLAGLSIFAVLKIPREGEVVGGG